MLTVVFCLWVYEKRMSLVGKEFQVAVGGNLSNEMDEDVSSTGEVTCPPLSPASGAEALFMPGLRTSNISPSALASELRKNYRTFRSASTVATDDFVSTCDNMDDLMKYEGSQSDLAKQPIFEEKMSSTNVDDVNVNAAEHVYEGVKNVWGWGKQQVIIKTFLGITEAVAGKVVSVVGTDLEEIDGNIKPQLSNFDNNILNPAVRAILGIVMNAAGKSENFLKPIIVSVLKPIGLIKNGKKPETAPELTNSRMAAAN